MTDDADANRDDREVVGGETGETASSDDGAAPNAGSAQGKTTISGEGKRDADPTGDDHGAEVVDTSVTVDGDDAGKTVRSDDGEELGLVTEVADSGDALFVDPHPRIAEHVAADHGWTERESGDFRVDAADVKAIDGDAVWLDEPE